MLDKDDAGNAGHIVKRVLQNSLLGAGFADPQIVDAVMKALAELRIINGDMGDIPPLLTVPGRILALVVESPGATIREIALKTGTTEANIQRTMTKLRKAGLVERQILKHRSLYSPSLDSIMKHPDAPHLASIISEVSKEVQTRE